jgi:hypothetical protein
MNPMKFDACTGILAGSGGLSDGPDVITTPVGSTQVVSLSSTPVSAVPKPSIFLLFGFGLLAPGLAQRRKLRPAKRGFGKTSAKAPLMEANNDDFSGRSGALIAGTLSALLALGGCGGGGGGGGGSAAGFSYPSSLAAAKSTDSVSGFVAPYALDPDPVTPALVSVPLTVVAVGSVTGTLTFTVEAMQLPSGAGIEPRFVVPFNPATSGMNLSNTPLDGLSCADCLITQPVVGNVTFTYLGPASFPLNYSTFGMWSKPSSQSPSWPEVGGIFSAGVLTRGIDLPVTWVPTHYDGYFIGRLSTSDTTASYPVGTYLVGAHAHAVVDSSGGVTFTIVSTNIFQEMSGGGLAAPILSPELSLTSTAAMPINRSSTTSTQFGPGELTTSPLVMAGEIKGAFYGPPAGTAGPPELGGSLAVQNSSQAPTQSMLGSFALKKQ